MGKRKKILLLWYMENSNFGDVLIYDTVSEKLKEKGYQVESHEVGDSSERILNHANECNFMLFAGGGIIERYIPEIIRKFVVNHKYLQVHYGVIGLGMGSFDYSQFYSSIRQWVEQSDFFYVRDIKTKKQLDAILGYEKVIYSADCVFANDRIDKYIYNYGKSFKTGRGVNLRDIPYKDLNGDFDWDIINSILNQIGCNISIPDSSKEITKASIEINNDIEEKIEASLPIEKVMITIDVISQCEWIVAMRYHVVLVAAMLDIPTIPIMYCPKVKYLAEQLGIMDLAIEFNEYDKIPKKIHQLNNEKQKYLLNLNKNVSEMKEKAELMFEHVLSCLEQ